MTAPGPVARSNSALPDVLDKLSQDQRESDRKVVREMRHTTTGYPGVVVGDTITIYDGSANPGNPIFQEDKSGVGLGLPWIPIPTISILGIPQTNVASYGPVASTLAFRKMSPYCSVAIYAQTQGGAIGNARVAINGTPVGTVLAIPVTSTQTLTQDLALPGNIGDMLTINVEVQVTNATGTVGAVFTATQRGTP